MSELDELRNYSGADGVKRSDSPNSLGIGSRGARVEVACAMRLRASPARFGNGKFAASQTKWLIWLGAGFDDSVRLAIYAKLVTIGLIELYRIQLGDIGAETTGQAGDHARAIYGIPIK